MNGDKFITIELHGSGWCADTEKRRQRDEAYLKMIGQLEDFLRSCGYIDVMKTASVTVRQKLDRDELHSVVTKSILVR